VSGKALSPLGLGEAVHGHRNCPRRRLSIPRGRLAAGNPAVRCRSPTPQPTPSVHPPSPNSATELCRAVAIRDRRGLQPDARRLVALIDATAAVLDGPGPSPARERGLSGGLPGSRARPTRPRIRCRGARVAQEVSWVSAQIASSSAALSSSLSEQAGSATAWLRGVAIAGASAVQPARGRQRRRGRLSNGWRRRARRCPTEGRPPCSSSPESPRVVVLVQFAISSAGRRSSVSASPSRWRS